MIEVLDSDNDVVRQYTWGLDLSQSVHGAGGVGGLLASVDKTGASDKSYWYTYDANGNVAQLMDATTPSSLVLAAHYEYDPYGNTLETIDADLSGIVDDNPIRFSTKWLDTEQITLFPHGAIAQNGLYYYGYRYYSPTLGRWTNPDPIEELGGLNLYGFVWNDPMNVIDPDGLEPSGSTSYQCYYSCGQCYNKCEEGKILPPIVGWHDWGYKRMTCEQLRQACRASCRLYGKPKSPCTMEDLPGSDTQLPDPVIPWLLCCGTDRHVPVIDYGPAHNAVVYSCTAASFLAPAGACCKVVFTGGKGVRAIQQGSVGCKLLRLRKYLRRDFPHHLKPTKHWGGKIPDWLRKKFCKN